MTPERTALLHAIAAELTGQDPGHPLRVGIDGVCGAGKTTFADELAGVIGAGTGARPVVHIDSDGFHHVRARRMRQGRMSARGYYEDAYDVDALAAHVLRPLGPGGSRRYAVRVHDLATDEQFVDDRAETAEAPPDAVVLFACTFLQRDELRALWDIVIFLDTDEPAALARGIARDRDALGGDAAAAEAYDARYMAACRLYLAEQHPREKADIVVDNTDPCAPALRTPLSAPGMLDA